jgi:YfiH family protein
MPLLSDFFPNSVAAYISDRTMDFTLSKNLPTFSKSQKDFLVKEINFPFDQILTVRQVHGKKIVVADKNWLHNKPEELIEADGIVTDLLDTPIAIRTADCVPIFLFDGHRKCIGLVHAGWRGTYEHIVSEALFAMKEKWGSDPKDIKAVIGPCIQSCCYQVGEEMKDFFQEGLIQCPSGYYLNLAEVNRKQLLREGVAPEHICDSKICTFCDHRCFSYRREKEMSGRMISVMMMRTKISMPAEIVFADMQEGRLNA